MRHLLTSVVLLVFLFPSLALGQGVTMDDLVERNGLYYEKFTNVPFTGKTTGKIQGSFKDGKMDGPYVFYWNNGQVHQKGTWKDGKRDGPWVTYWSNGQLYLKGTYKDGVKDGPWIAYRKDGTVHEEWTVTYRNGVKVE